MKEKICKKEGEKTGKNNVTKRNENWRRWSRKPTKKIKIGGKPGEYNPTMLVQHYVYTYNEPKEANALNDLRLFYNFFFKHNFWDEKAWIRFLSVTLSFYDSRDSFLTNSRWTYWSVIILTCSCHNYRINGSKNQAKADRVWQEVAMVVDLRWLLSPSKDLVIVVNRTLSYAVVKSKELLPTNLHTTKKLSHTCFESIRITSNQTWEPFPFSNCQPLCNNVIVS